MNDLSPMPELELPTDAGSVAQPRIRPMQTRPIVDLSQHCGDVFTAHPVRCGCARKAAGVGEEVRCTQPVTMGMCAKCQGRA
jgi:hypothetical protein